MKKEKKITQKIPSGIFAECKYLRLTDQWCTKYNNDAKYNQGQYNYDRFCMSHGGCDGEYN